MIPPPSPREIVTLGGLVVALVVLALVASAAAS